MTLNEITDRVPEVRILATGYISEVSKINYNDKTICIVDDELEMPIPFSFVQFLTPLEFEGRRIGIGDKVKCDENDDDFVVYGFHWCDGEWFIDTFQYDDLDSGCLKLAIDDINSVIPLKPEVDKKAQEWLEKNGKWYFYGIKEMKKNGGLVGEWKRIKI